MKRPGVLSVAVGVLLAASLAACGQTAPATKAAPAGTWVLRFDRSVGGADGEQLSPLYLSVSADGASAATELPGKVAAAASGITRVLMVDSSHTWALADSRPSKADRRAHQVRLYPLKTGDPTIFSLGEVRPDYVVFSPHQATLNVVSGKQVWHFDLDSGKGTKVDELRVKPEWIFVGGFDVNTAAPYVESLGAFETDPPGNGADTTKVIERSGGVVTPTPTGTLPNLPDAGCDLASGFDDGAGGWSMWCVQGQDLTLMSLEGQEWKTVGGPIKGVVPTDVVEFVFALPPVDA